MNQDTFPDDRDSRGSLRGEHDSGEPLNDEILNEIAIDPIHRLWSIVAPDNYVHIIDDTKLSEYVGVLLVDGRRAASIEFPEVEAHRQDGCAYCEDSIRKLIDFIRHLGRPRRR